MTNLPIDPNAIPDFLRQAYESSSVSNLVRNTAPDRISIKGRVWRMIKGGQEVAANPAPSMQFVLVAAAPKVSRAYYPGVFSDDKKEAPDCWSNNGETPDAQAQKPQAANCAQCPMNVPGSGQNGSRACRHNQRIAVALPDRLDEPFAMTIPATSLWGDKVPQGHPAPLTQYAAFLASQRIPMEGVITEFSFDINETAPTIRFRPVGYLDQARFVKVQQLAKTPEALAAIEQNVIVREVAALPAGNQPIAAPVVAMPVQQAAPIQYSSTVQMPAQQAYQQPVQQAFAPQEQPVIRNGFGQTAPVETQVPQTFAQPTTTVQPTNNGFGQQAGFGAPAQQQGFGAPEQPAPAKRTRARKTDAPTQAASFGTQVSEPAVQNGFGAPAQQQGFGTPEQAAPVEQAAQAFAEPVVISPQTAAAQSGTPVEDITALLNQWGAQK